MRSTPVLAALLVALAGLTVGPVAAAPSTADTTPTDLHGQVLDEVENASVDRLVLAEATATITVDEMAVDRVETDQGTFENATLEDATVSVEDATVVVTNLSTEAGDDGHAFVHVEDGEVTVEEATATANGAEFTVNDVNLTVENESAERSGIDGQATQMQVDAEGLQQLAEGASVENLSIDGVSADGDVVVANAEGIQLDDRTGSGYFGDVVLESFEDASVSAESASIEDGTLVLENAEMSVEDAEATIDIGVTVMGQEVRVHDNVEVELEDSLTVERDEVRIPLW